MSRGTAGVLTIAAMTVGLACTAQPSAPAPRSATEALTQSASVTVTTAVTSMTALAGSSRVAAGLADGRVAIWNGHDAAPEMTLTPHATPVLAVGSSRDSDHVWSVASDGTLMHTPIKGGGAVSPLRVDLGAAATRAAAFAPDGSTLVTGNAFGEVRVFDTASGTLKHQLRGHRTELQSIAVSTGGAIAATASAESDLRIWDSSTGREMQMVDGDLSLFALGFSPRDGTLASGGVDRRLTLRDPKTFAAVGEFTVPRPRMVGSLAWSADGRFIAVGDIDDETLTKGRIDIVEAASRRVVAHLDTGGVPVPFMAFVGSEGTLVAAVGRDLRAWTIAGLK